MDAAGVRRQLRQLGLEPRRTLGQHFLIDASVIRASVAAAELTRRDTVLEIGGGLGALTAALAEAAGRLVVVERDRRLTAHLTRRFVDQSSVTVMAGDIFRIRLPELLADGQYSLVANLPYQITSLVFRNFLTRAPRPRQLVVLVQKEVADRLAGRDGNRSRLWLLAALAGTTEVMRTVDRRAFVPPPAVTSALVRLRLHPSLPPDAEGLLKLGRLAFVGRRKQLKNSLAAGLGLPAETVAAVLRNAGLDPTVRPQDLALHEWRFILRSLIDSGVRP